MREDVVIELIEVCKSCEARPGDMGDASQVEAVECKAEGIGDEYQASKRERLKRCQQIYHLVSYVIW